MKNQEENAAKRLTLWSIVAGLCIAGAVSGCRTGPALSPVNLDEPGWVVSRGEAVWRRGDSLDLAGEVLVAVSGKRSFVQFTKGPLPIVTARQEGPKWEIRFPLENRRFSGRGLPPRSLAWLHLASAVSGQPQVRGVSWTRSGGSWKLESRADTIEGVFPE